MPPSKLGNTSNRERRLLRWASRFEGLTSKAINTLERLMDGDDSAVALGAAKEVLLRGLGKPASETNVNVNVQSPAAAHVTALQELTALAVQAKRVNDAKSLNIKDITLVSDKAAINQPLVIEHQPNAVSGNNQEKSKA